MTTIAELARKIAAAGGFPPIGKVVREGNAPGDPALVNFFDNKGKWVGAMWEDQYQTLLSSLRDGDGD